MASNEQETCPVDCLSLDVEDVQSQILETHAVQSELEISEKLSFHTCYHEGQTCTIPEDVPSQILETRAGQSDLEMSEKA